MRPSGDKAEKSTGEKAQKRKDRKIKKAQEKAAKKSSGKKFRMWSFSRKLLAMCLLPMLLTCFLVTFTSTSSLKSSLESEVENAMRVSAVSITETYTNLYVGDYWQDKSGAIYKGDTKIAGKPQLLDAIAETTGYDVSMLFGKMRLLTTLKRENGGRINGTTLDDELYARIEEGEPFFLRGVEVNHIECYAYYEPLVNSDGTIFGAVEVAFPKESVDKMTSAQTTKLIIYSAIIVLVVCVMVIFISRGMVSKMEQIKRFLDRIIEGRLDHKPNAKSLKANDELGDVYRSSVQLQGTVHDMVGGIKTSSDNLKISAGNLSGFAQNTATAAEDVQRAVELISDGARSQADSTNDARGSIIMINNQIEQIIDEVNMMADGANEMSKQERQSEKIIQELSDSCDDTKESVKKATEQITLMSEAIGEIKSTMTLIQSIADETDLLAINANIEAAKAGEAGRGFSVVADQISKLAIQSNNSSQDSQHIIDRILKITEGAVAVMDEVRYNMDVQQQKLNLTMETYKKVSDGVEQSLKNMDNIKNKIDILNASGMDISNAIDTLSEVSEQNANSASNTIQVVNDMNDTMQKVQASSVELLTMADELQKMMGTFQI